MKGLEEAFQPYAQGFGLAEINATAAYLQADAEQGHVHTVIEVHNQTVTFPRRKNKECLDGCDSWFHLLKASLERGMQEGRLSIPEGVPFLVNVNDDSWCHVAEDGTSKCTAPLLSIFKSKFDRDILVPNFKPELFEPIFSPWENKKEIAFFRGSPICSFPSLNGTRPSPSSGANCSRWVVAQLSWDHPELINATLTENVTQYGAAVPPVPPVPQCSHSTSGCGPGSAFVNLGSPFGIGTCAAGPLWVDMPRVSHQEAAEYKYVLAVDGATAAYRLAFLMATNSVVLKQVTDKIEWYYGAIHPCEHYFPFWVHNETDVVQLVQQLQGNPDNDLTAQHIAANSQAFALTYLSHEYAFWYWQALIDKYVALYRGPKRRGSGCGGSSGGGGGGSEADAGSSGSSSSGPADTGEEGSSNGSAGDSSSIPAEPGAGGSKAGGGSEATPPDSSSEAG
ncbi:hypothetical protein COHA_001521 [Chlorella ohadii]|uniref:Glycosyl transferase CAP10 domain-containing protein n=1 Tax=Chlorella ohadii TaxID=2649997 RepID=A0AAD5DYE0_9CHLO|nr:hypothetical protein COHA_001521 [Chlorella ohadii]